MILYVVLKNGSIVSIYDVDEITRIDAFNTFTVHGIFFDYSIVDRIWYINDNAPTGRQMIYIFVNGHFVCAPYDCLKYIRPIRDSEGVNFLRMISSI